MANFSNSIDLNIFAACKIAEVSMKINRAPLNIMLLSGPGLGKSTAVSMYAKINDYELVMLRGNSMDKDGINGYDSAPGNVDDSHKAAIHLRPSWFQEVLDNKERGKKTLLFLDEITTADDFVQSAMLEIVLGRKVNNEYLPEDTLIIAAGNYAANLNNYMQVLAPMLNRFIIVNIIPGKEDIKHFLCKYEGSLAGSRIDMEGEITRLMKEMNEREIVDPSPEFIDKASEYFESALRIETELLFDEKCHTFAVSDLMNIYSDVENDNALANFITFRTLNMARDMALAAYIAMGSKAGILSDNFKNMIHGTIGLALSRDSKTGLVNKTFVTDRYYEVLCEAANDIEKIDNDKLSDYVSYFNESIPKTTKVITLEEMNLIKNKINQMENDKTILKINRPIDHVVIKRLCDCLAKTLKDSSMSKKISTIISTTTDISKEIDLGEFASTITIWNGVADLMSELCALLYNADRKYQKEIKEEVKSIIESSFKPEQYSLKRILKALNRAKEIDGMDISLEILPAIKSIR